MKRGAATGTLMSSSNLAKRLQREIKASPQKAAILGVLAVVALYFWAPLLIGWFSGGPSSVTVATAPVSVEAIQPVERSAGEGQAVAKGATWQQVDAWIAQDKMMKPAATQLALRNPFQMQGGATQTGPWAIGKVESGYTHAKQALEMISSRLFPSSDEDAVSPSEAGLVVTSTIAGGKRPVALINGRAYAQGSVVRGEGEFPSTKFTLIEVRSKSVLLRGRGLVYEVKIGPVDLALAGEDSAADSPVAAESGG